MIRRYISLSGAELILQVGNTGGDEMQCTSEMQSATDTHLAQDMQSASDTESCSEAQASPGESSREEALRPVGTDLSFYIDWGSMSCMSSCMAEAPQRLPAMQNGWQDRRFLPTRRQSLSHLPYLS